MNTTEICMLVTMGVAITLTINYFLKSRLYKRVLWAVIEDPNLYARMRNDWMEATGRKGDICRVKKVEGQAKE